MLPSKYSDEGLSAGDQKKFITTKKTRLQNGESMEWRIKQLVEELQIQNNIQPRGAADPPQRQGSNQDGDIVMIGSDDYAEVESIAEAVESNRRNSSTTESDRGLEMLSSEFFGRAPPTKVSQKTIFLVIDTNFIVSHLDILDGLVKLYHDYKESYQLVIPRTTIQELDGLKTSKKHELSQGVVSTKSISMLARWANEWCYKNLADSNPLMKIQKFDERLDFNTKKDDAILDCGLYLQKQFPNHLVILLSNDKNFCVKLLAEGILTISYRPKMSAKLIADRITQENLNRGNGLNFPLENGASDKIGDLDIDQLGNNEDAMEMEMEIETPTRDEHARSKTVEKTLHLHLININNNFEQGVEIIYSEIQTLLISLVDKTMKEEYAEDLQLLGFKKPQKMSQVLEAIVEYWIPVFHSKIHALNFLEEFGKKYPSSRLKITLVPSNVNDLTRFTKFWSLVLKELYRYKSGKDIDALAKLIERWENILHQMQ